MQSFDEFGLAEPIRRALQAENHTAPTPIQAQAVPRLLEGHDLLGIAQTGTGKTLAFTLPILQKLAGYQGKRAPKAPQALILAPTRELARQIHERVRAYGRYLHLKSTAIFGGVKQGPQVKALARGVDILIATPGRLLDLHQQNHLRLDSVEILVLDEADLMLDMGFVRDVRKIAAACGKDRQTLLFSATMPPAIAKLAQELLDRPERVDVAPKTVAVERIDQHVHFISSRGKSQLLSELLSDDAMDRVIVFTRTKRSADRVCKHLRQGDVTAEALHGNKSQNARIRSLEDFKFGRVRVLVATDIAARGIDISAVSHVINYELPNEPESYVHRIGRTARAGADGAAVSFCDHSERAQLRAIERLIRRQVPVASGSAEALEDEGRSKPGNRNGGNGKPAAPKRNRRRRSKPAAFGKPRSGARRGSHGGSHGSSNNGARQAEIRA
ncbi:DEAD/DEAH box helicase [Methyloligella sp. GL2]|nr:DEAD/DEAH box helicase [Methyloligella sp. GL2]